MESRHEVVLDKHWQLLVDNVSRPVEVTKGWEQQGMETWCGPGHYQLRFALETITDDIELYLPQVQGSVAIWLNDTLIAEKGWPEYRFTLPQSLLKSVMNWRSWSTHRQRIIIILRVHGRGMSGIAAV